MFIVGIGSSAGGLEALQKFISGLIHGSADVTYLVAQHLSPQHKSMLVELLGKSDNIDVVVAKHNSTLCAGKMYITPPNADIKINKNKIVLSEPRDGAGPKPSADKLFRSMSEEYNVQSIGIILSGTGSDGALGIQSIRAEGGITIAQDPETAKYDGMPQAAIDTDCVDAVLAPEKIGEYLAKVIKTGRERPKLTSNSSKEKFDSILLEIENRTGMSFYGYKTSTLQRRLERRMVANGIPNLELYVDYLKENAEEPGLIAQDFLISVTEFFRDKNAFQSLRKLLKKKLQDQDTVQSMRIWSVGCATGEEPYSIAMLCADALGGADQLYKHRIQIFATDIDSNALAIARNGSYNSAAIENIPEDLRRQYFIANEDKHMVIKQLKDIVLFSKHNILENPPFSRIDLIVCRNVLIYFTNEFQEKAFKIFHYSLSSDGSMFLGKSESTGKAEPLFRKSGIAGNFFTRKAASLSAPMGMKFNRQDGRIREISSKKKETENDSSKLLSSILASLAPNSVLVNQNLEIMHIYGDVSAFLKLASGKPSMNLTDIIIEPFKQEIRVYGYKVIRENQTAKTSIRPINIGGVSFQAKINFYPITVENSDRMLLVSFDAETVNEDNKDASKLNVGHPDVVMLEQELQATQEHLQTVIEELETVNEELQSTNEELQSSNEELHSTNEELETSNEELQSTNEELTTVNDELNQKKTELEDGNIELSNILNSVQFPMIRLNDNLQIVRSNEIAQKLFDLTNEIELPLVRSLPDELDVMKVVKSANDVLQNRTPDDMSLEYKNRLYWLRFYPYTTSKKETVGVILTFIDETEQAKQREKLDDIQARYSAIASTSIIPIYIKDLDGRYLAANAAVQELMGFSDGEILGKRDNDFLPEHIFVEQFRNNDLKVQRERRTLSFKEEYKNEDGSVTYYLSVKAPLIDKNGHVYATSGVSIDITNELNYSKKLELKNEEVARANEVKSEFLANMSHEMRTPLNAICGIADILEHFELDNTKRINLTQKLNVASQQLYDLINDILDYSSIEGNEFNLNDTVFCLAELCQELEAINSIKADKKGLTLKIGDVENTNQFYWGDKTRLKQVLLNIIDNGIKFTERGTVSLSLSATPSKNSKCFDIVTFDVVDTGIGIPVSQTERIFQKFAQGTNTLTDKTSGTGLGLSITKAILEKMHGSISVKDTGKKGSTFCVSIPLKRASSDDLPLISQPQANNDLSDITPSGPILIVEDTQANIDVMCSYLDHVELPWDVAKSGEQALQKINAQHYSIVLLDLQMSDIDGFKVAQIVKQHKNEDINSLPLVAVTGHAEDMIKEKCFKIGMTDFLVKPLSLKKLSEILLMHMRVKNK